MEIIGLPELTPEQKENLCILTEEAARDYIKSKIPSNRIQTLDIDVEIKGQKPITVTIDIHLELAPEVKNSNAEQLAKEATQEAQETANRHLRQIACKSTT